MIVGVPREIKQDEYRVAMLPVGVEELVGDGHRVLIERGAGTGSGIDDEIYEVTAGDAVHLPPRVKHGVINDSEDDIEYLNITGIVE